MKPEAPTYVEPTTEASSPRPSPAPQKQAKMRLAFVHSPALVRYMMVLVITAFVTAILATALMIGLHGVISDAPNSKPTAGKPSDDANATYPFADGAEGVALIPWAENVTVIPVESIAAEHAALADLSSGQIIASRKADDIIYPASMTKVMTLIVAVENLKNESSLKDTVTISQEVYDKMRAQEASGVGFEAGEQLTVEALLYALILKSDGIAACELARYVAGSEEAFVALMNQKAAQMGLTHTHFENPTGLHHANHKSTSREIASIMAYAMKMNLCRKILSAKSYTAPCVGAGGKNFKYDFYHKLLVELFDATPSHQPTAMSVIAGKTGYTDEGLFCLVTYAETPDGRAYVCVTAEAKTKNYHACITDYLTIYNTYAKP